MKTLTGKQKSVLDYIQKYIDENGISPTIKEIQNELFIKSPATIHQHLKNLNKKGYIWKEENSVRNIKLVQESEIQIPVLGYIAAGEPIEAIESENETVSVGTEFRNKIKDHYALKVRGDSMIDEGIYDGDIVIIKKQSVAENGQTVVAIIDENEATLKKIYREGNQFKLEPANQNLLPFYRDEVEVRGVVVNVVRNLNKVTNNKNSKSKNLRTIDLFAGIGGVRLGFEEAGFKTVFSNDFEEKCKLTYDENFPDSKLVVEDIRKIGIDDLPEFDFLLGGFPCQAFSIAGYRQGFSDEKGRGNLFFDIARIIEARQPAGFLLENVKNLYGHDGGKTFKVISETLKELGYHVKAKVLNSMEYGNIPQNRERVYIVGFKNKKHYDNFEFPGPIKLEVSITDLLEKKKVDNKYYYNDKPLWEKLSRYEFAPGVVYQWRRKYVRENKSGVCPTLTANMGTGGHNVPIIKDRWGVRKLTPKECSRIQGFPEEYILPDIADSHLYMQIGNSVPVPVVKRIAKKIAEVV